MALLLKQGRVFGQGQTKTLFQEDSISELLGYPVTITPTAAGTMSVQVPNVQADIVQYWQ